MGRFFHIRSKGEGSKSFTAYLCHDRDTGWMFQQFQHNTRRIPWINLIWARKKENRLAKAGIVWFTEGCSIAQSLASAVFLQISLPKMLYIKPHHSWCGFFVFSLTLMHLGSPVKDPLVTIHRPTFYQGGSRYIGGAHCADPFCCQGS